MRTVLLCLACLGATALAVEAQTPVPLNEPPKGLMPNLGRPTRADDVVPLLDFDKYFLGTWTFAADAPDSVLGPGGVSTGSVTYRKVDDGFYEAIVEGKGETGAFRIVESIAYDREQQMAFRHVTDSRGYSYTQMARVGGNIGGDYRLFFQSAPFTYRGKQVRLNHTIYLAAPLTFRTDIEVAEGRGPLVHMSPWHYRKVR